MKRKSKFIVLSIGLIFMLSACWDARNIDDLYLVFAIGIDISKDSEDQYLVTIVSPTVDPEAQESKIEISSVSNTLRNAQDNIQNKSSRRITFNNTKMFILGEDVAKQGIRRHLDTLVRDPESRGTIRMIVTEGRATDLMNIEPKFAPLVSLYLFDLVQNSFFTSTVPFTTVREFNNDLHTDGIEPTVPYLKYGNTKEEQIVNSTAIFEKDKMIGTLTHDESVAFALLKASARDGFLTSHLPDSESDYVTIRKLGGKNRIVVKVVEDNIFIDHYITIDAAITEQTSPLPLDQDVIRRLEKVFAYQVKLMCEEIVNKLQNDFKVDSIGYGKNVRAYHPNYFDGQKWNETFQDVDINIVTKINIVSIGTIE